MFVFIVHDVDGSCFSFALIDRMYAIAFESLPPPHPPSLSPSAPSLSLSHTHTTHTHTQTQARARTHAHEHTRARAHTHTHIYIYRPLSLSPTPSIYIPPPPPISLCPDRLFCSQHFERFYYPLGMPWSIFLHLTFLSFLFLLLPLPPPPPPPTPAFSPSIARFDSQENTFFQYPNIHLNRQ